MSGEPTRTTSPESEERVTVPEAHDEVDAPTTLGHFELGARLGGGGMGVVFRARDTLLDRVVALKLVRPDARLRGDKARQRLLREAQALARLKHPNVVTVFEVGAAGDEIFIAMELVEGDTLRDWMRQPHDWRAIVDLFLAVGRGLAAAHALGLVHRDVKPSNVFLDRDGTPKIGDFGLVAWAGALELDHESSTSTGPLDRSLTTTGSVMGTPAYMAPEQIEGERADARADQYAFAVSLYEALTGKLPTDDRLPLPRKLEPILARAMQPSPAARYPTMDALCAELARARRGHARAWIAAGAAAGALVIAAGAWTLAQHRAAGADPCPVPTAAFDPVWGDARRAAVREHVRSIDPGEGEARAAAIAARVDPYVRGWRDLRVEACRATRVRGEQSDTLYDLRMACLDRRLGELDTAIGLVAEARTLPALDQAVGGLAQLTPLDGCSDAAALTAAAPPPAQPAARAKADAIARAIDDIMVRAHAGRLDGLLAKAKQVVADARALDHPPTLAAALATLSRVQLDLEDNDSAQATLRELTQVAARAHDDRDEAFAWTKLIGQIGGEQGKIDEAMTLVPAANAAVLRAGEPVDLRTALLYVEGQVLDEGPHAKDGLAKLDEARAMLEQAGAAQPSSPLAAQYADVWLEIATARGYTDDVDGAIAAYHRSIDLNRALFGPDSPDEAYSWHDLGDILDKARRYDEATAAFATAIRIRERRIGDSPTLASDLVGAATVLTDQRRYDEALPLLDRALAMDRAQLQPTDPQLAAVMMTRAMALEHVGRFDDAMRAYDDTLAQFERSGARTINLPIAIYNRAEALRAHDRCPEALADYARSASLFEEMRGKDDHHVAYPLVGQGQCLLAQHRAADAIAPLERAHAVAGAGPQDALARYELGRALVESGRDRRGGLAMARAARPDLSADTRDLADVDRWLATHE